MAQYNKIFKKTVAALGNGSTYGDDLDRYCKRKLGDKFMGVYAADEIPDLEGGVCCISNLSKRSEPGSHWIGLAGVDGKVIMYDSFGRSPSKILKNSKGIIATDSDAEQREEEENCGARTVAWLLYLDEYGMDSAIMI